MAVSAIQTQVAKVKTFTFNSLNIKVYVFPNQLRLVEVSTNSQITQAVTGWTNVGAYSDGLKTCTVHADNDKIMAFRQSGSQLQIKVSEALSNVWFVGTAAGVA